MSLPIPVPKRRRCKCATTHSLHMAKLQARGHNTSLDSLPLAPHELVSQLSPMCEGRGKG